jgi:glutamate synthase domain-containing protein 2
MAQPDSRSPQYCWAIVRVIISLMEHFKGERKHIVLSSTIKNQHPGDAILCGVTFLKLLYPLIGVLALIGLFILIELYIIFRVRLFVGRMLTDGYKDNIYGMIHSAQRTGLENVIELSLRAERGKVLKRPMGTARKLPNFSGLAFDQPNLAVPITPMNKRVDMTVDIGPKATRPLKVQIPILISGMGYGVAVSYKTKMAWALAANKVGTATNTGEGPYLPDERRIAERLIIQFGRVGWMPVEALRQADMVEIQAGQGSSGSAGHMIQEKILRGRAAEMFGLNPGEKVISHSHLAWQGKSISLKDLIREIRGISPEIPVGVKIGAGCISLEKDLGIILEAGVDFITVDGMNAATSGELPIIQDDFGLPTILALLRTVAFLNAQGVREQVSLIISGGFFSPGDMLKALALGADAIYLGTMILFASAHNQGNIAMPWEPIGSVNWYVDQLSRRLKVKPAADYVANYIQSTILEMEEGIRTIGKSSIKQLSSDDLRSITVEAYRLTGITPAFDWLR